MYRLPFTKINWERKKYWNNSQSTSTWFFI